MKKYVLTDGSIMQNSGYLAVFAALCSLAAAMTSVISAVVASLITVVALILSAITVSAMKKVVPEGSRLAFGLIVSTFFALLTTMALHAVMAEMYNVVGAYIPVLASAGMMLGRECGSAYENSPVKSAFNAAKDGVCVIAAAVVVSALSEFLSTGLVMGFSLLDMSGYTVAMFGMTSGVLLLVAFVAAVFSKKTPAEFSINNPVLVYMAVAAAAGAVIGSVGIVNGAVTAVIFVVAAAVFLPALALLRGRMTADTIPGCMKKVPVFILSLSLAAVALHTLFGMF